MADILDCWAQILALLGLEPGPTLLICGLCLALVLLHAYDQR
jgi:hypothetical protein